MGLSPTDPTYAVGDRCGECEDTLFGGTTPKYVFANCLDIVPCPGYVQWSGNQLVLLTQVMPCAWTGAAGVFILYWFLNVAETRFKIIGPDGVVFLRVYQIGCIDFFTNVHEACGGFMFSGAEGTVEIWWGPTIGPSC